MPPVSLTNLFPTNFLNDTEIHQSLGEEFSLCDHGNMVFHWADFHETCDAVKESMETNPSLLEDFKRREASLGQLSLIPVWIRTKSKVQQTTLFDLYQKHILNKTHLLGGIDPFGPLQISLISGSGPYKSMSIAECFNSKTYQDFVLVSLLKGELPKRNFRIRLKSKVLVEYGIEFSNAKLINLEQMTTSGLLFSVDADFYNKELSGTPSIRVLIDANLLHSSLNKPLADLKTYLSEHTFNLLYSSRKEDAIECSLSDFSIQSSFDFYKNKKVYLFTSYESLAQNGEISARNIKAFVDYTRELVRNHYQSLSQKLKSA
jgi:hypothetical protein